MYMCVYIYIYICIHMYTHIEGWLGLIVIAIIVVVTAIIVIAIIMIFFLLLLVERGRPGHLHAVRRGGRRALERDDPGEARGVRVQLPGLIIIVIVIIIISSRSSSIITIPNLIIIMIIICIIVNYQVFSRERDELKGRLCGEALTLTSA